MRTLRKRVATGTAFAAESLSASPAFFVRPCSEPFGLLAAARRSPAASKPSSLLRFLELLLPPRLRTGDVDRPRNPLDRSEEPFPFTTRDEERRRTGEALVPIVVADPQLERGCQVLGKWRRFWRCLEFGSHPLNLFTLGRDAERLAGPCERASAAGAACSPSCLLLEGSPGAGHGQLRGTRGP
jgi:hypothetical protein